MFFRHSEVIAAGNLFSTVSYPLIDIAKGGTIQGVIDGLNHILDLSVAEYRSQGGTWIIPGRGRLSDTADVASYRNMLVMIRDRVRDLKKKGMTLEQVKAARPTLDFDGRYGSTTGAWTTSMFVEAVYKPSGEVSHMRKLLLMIARCGRRRWRRRLTFAHHSSVRPTRPPNRSSSKAPSSSSCTGIRTRSCTSRRRTRAVSSQRWAVEWGGPRSWRSPA